MPYPQLGSLKRALLLVVGGPALGTPDGSPPEVPGERVRERLAHHFALSTEEVTRRYETVAGTEVFRSLIAHAVQALRDDGLLVGVGAVERGSLQATTHGVAEVRALVAVDPTAAQLAYMPIDLAATCGRKALDLPRPREAEDPLLVLLACGTVPGSGLPSSAVYQRLATFFDLGEAQRNELRGDTPGKGKLWDNVVQNARKALVARGFVEPPSKATVGVWIPTEEGRRHAAEIAASQAFAAHPRFAVLASTD